MWHTAATWPGWLIKKYTSQETVTQINVVQINHHIYCLSHNINHFIVTSGIIDINVISHIF